ncbi:MAG: hypothetical protein FWD40_04920 [Treponema sp.]|nr:hypothetical protein [Treponema sp.]
MSDAVFTERRKPSKTPLDFFIVLFCAGGVAVSLFLFQQDLFMTFRSLDNPPAGVVTVKFNTVQRRLEDRVVWDRLFDDSPVYNGDIIRIARDSGAVLNIDESEIELGENTLIRIQKDEGRPLQIEFFTGEASIIANRDGEAVLLSIGDRVVEAAPGTVFNIRTVQDILGNESLVLNVTDGEAQIRQDGQISFIPAGSLIVQDTQGNESRQPMAAVIHPRPNARFLKTEQHPLSVDFSWARINMQQPELLRLEIAEDRNFANIVQIIDNLDSNTAADFNPGLWHWRLSLEGNVLAGGRISVTDASAPSLLSPAHGHVFQSSAAVPQIQFRWSEIADAQFYILQLSDSPDFYNPEISRQVQSSSFVIPNLNTGTWYWRVQPVFSSDFEGAARFSQTSSFQIALQPAAELAAVELKSPNVNSPVVLGEDSRDFHFSWTAVNEAISYTFQISASNNFINPLVTKTLRDNFYTYRADDGVLAPGQYYWRVIYTTADGHSSAPAQARSFIAMEKEIIHRLLFPPDRHRLREDETAELIFTWESDLMHDRRFQVSSLPDFSRMQLDVPVTGYNYSGISLPPGEWYWRVSARDDGPVVPAVARRFNVEAAPVAWIANPALEETAAAIEQAMPFALRQTEADWQFIMSEAIAGDTAAAAMSLEAIAARSLEAAAASITQPPPPVFVRLISPSNDAVVPGLIALRQPTQFRWDIDEEIVSSRFVLSRRANPGVGRPDIEIINPQRTVSINALQEGLWYWSVEARTRSGRLVTAQSPRQLRVQPIPLLPAAENRSPSAGYTLGPQQLREQRQIEFSWTAVQGANSYIFTIYRESSVQRQQVYQTETRSQLNHNLDISLLGESGNYTWQVEAVFYNNNGRIEQRGRTAENSFVINAPRPGRVQTVDMGVLYGIH